MSYQEDLILSIYNKGEAGLAMGGEEEGGRSPYEPYKPAPSGPYVPAPSREIRLARMKKRSNNNVNET